MSVKLLKYPSSIKFKIYTESDDCPARSGRALERYPSQARGPDANRLGCKRRMGSNPILSVMQMYPRGHKGVVLKISGICPGGSNPSICVSVYVAVCGSMFSSYALSTS